MHRFSFLGLIPAIAAVAACSLVNAPADVMPGTGGGASSSASGGMTCHKDSDCPASTDCTKSSCGTDHLCKVVQLDGTQCDGGFCMQNATCVAGTCQGTPMKCPDQDPCNVGSCDEPSKSCKIVTGNEGGPCDDGDPCTDDGVCQAGVCTTGPDACAKLATDCSDAMCVTGTGCVTTPKLDLSPCGLSFCSNGQCMGGHCDITPVNEGMPCDDKLFCVINETCHNGFCVGEPNPCPTGNQCIKGTCDEAGATCMQATIPEGSACDDGNGCSANEFCSGGVCTGGITPTTLFSEDFADNSKGWTRGMEWDIGPAMVSTGQEDFGGFGDPGTDVTGEGGVAGVVIGGNEYVDADPALQTHPFYYLTSPVINTNVAKSMYVTFYRWLDSDYDPFMHSTVEATADGANWTVVWSTADIPIQDGAWTFQAIDITAFKSPTMQVRWGFDIGSSGVYRVSSWNIDKVRVQNAPCPN
jgi:hypothetical protein